MKWQILTLLLQFRGELTHFDITSAEFYITSAEVSRQSFTILLQFRDEVAEFSIILPMYVYVIDRI